MSLFDQFMHNVRDIFSYIWKGVKIPARFELGAFGDFYIPKERTGQGEGAGGGYKVQPRVNDQKPTPFTGTGQ